MNEHQAQVKAENINLKVKINELIDFMHGDIYSGLPSVEQGLLMVQLRQTKSLNDTLQERIDMFECRPTKNMNDVKVTIKTQRNSDFLDIKEFSVDLPAKSTLENVINWVNSMITDEFTVMGASICEKND